MERVIYCPSDDCLDEASALANENGLPIIVGDNSKTEDLTFDRDSVQVLEVPTIQSLRVHPQFLQLGKIVKIEYADDFYPVDAISAEVEDSFGNKISLDSDVSVDKKSVRFKIRPTVVGAHTGSLFDDSGTVATFEFEVRA